MSDLGTLFVRLCAIAPLLYIAVALMTDPASFVWMLDSFATEVRSFEQRWRGIYPARPIHSPSPVRITGKQRIAFQGVGVILIAISLLVIVA
jgi:hypothetical protein